MKVRGYEGTEKEKILRDLADALFPDLFDTEKKRREFRQTGEFAETLATKRVGLCLLCPITNKAKGYPFEVLIPAGFAVTGVVLSAPSEKFRLASAKRRVCRTVAKSCNK